MKRLVRRMSWLLAIAWLVAGLPSSTAAKSYSSGGHSYSSHSSSFGGGHSFSSGGHSFSSGGSHSSGWGSSHSSGGGGKSFNSGGGHSYSSGSSWSDAGRHSYSSGKSYSSGSGLGFGSLFGSGSSGSSSRSVSRTGTSAGGSGFSFDTAAAHARKEEASRTKYTEFKDSQAPRVSATESSARASDSGGSYRVRPPPVTTYGGGYYHRSVVYIPDIQVIRTRPVRYYNVFNPYSSRGWVTYNDPYGSLFWWWLLDRSLDDRAWWAYHHRYDMDPARYQALLAADQNLEARVEQLEAQPTPRDPNYVPTGLDRDLMYSDDYVARAYGNRPTAFGIIAFWALGIPLALGFLVFFIWLIWFKRWQTAT
ncbi:MAG TPA: hypothetical protein VMU04_14750 [Candidatus Acidoferrum sp.]|nr:hypothetical protein [Candidatus Acidoferrum sp.]